MSIETILILAVMLATLVAFVVATILYAREMARQRRAMGLIRDEIRAAVLMSLDRARRAALADVDIQPDELMPLLQQTALDATGARLAIETLVAVREAPVPALVAGARDAGRDLEVIYTPNGAAYREHVLALARRDNGVLSYPASPANASLTVDEELRQAWQLAAAERGVPEGKRTLPRSPSWDILIVPGNGGRDA